MQFKRKNWKIINQKNIWKLESIFKMGKNNEIKVGNIEIKKPKFYQYQSPISIKNIDIDKIVVSNKVSFGKKSFRYFIGYKDVKKIRPWCIFHPKVSAYRIDFGETKYISFLIKDNELSEKKKNFGKRLKIVCKTNLIVNLYTTKNL